MRMSTANLLAGDATGRGLWLANQLCNLVQIRSSPEGTTVRLHMRLDEELRSQV